METKGATRPILALTLLDVIVSKETQEKSTVYGSDKEDHWIQMSLLPLNVSITTNLSFHQCDLQLSSM